MYIYKLNESIIIIIMTTFIKPSDTTKLKIQLQLLQDTLVEPHP